MPELLSLDQSFKLNLDETNDLFSKHVNKYLLQVYEIIGCDKIDIEKAQGVELWLKNGRKMLDFSGGIGVIGVGHNHPRIIAAERRCHDELAIDSIRMAPNRLHGALGYNIAQMLPDPLAVSYFAVSGSEAVESALKLCERAQGPSKNKFICMEGSFHGKTHGSLAVTTAHRFQDGFLLGIPAENVIPVPAGDFAALEQAIKAQTQGGKNDICALIVEPMSGEVASVPPDGYLTQINDLCHANDILTIFDEVKCGMGRSGRFCAFQYEDVVPDVVTMAKALGGSKRAIGVCVSSQALFDKAYGSKQNATLHSCSFGGLGESCAVAIETLNILQDENLIERADTVGQYFGEQLEQLQKKHPKSIIDTRGRGLFRAIRLNFGENLISKVINTQTNSLFKTYQTVLVSAVVRELHENHGVIVHFQPGAVDVLHFMPALVVSEEQIDQLINGLDSILSKGIADATIQLVLKNIKRVFGG